MEKETQKTPLAAVLKDILKEKGWKQAELARRVGLERGTVWKYVHAHVDKRTGKVNQPSLETVRALAKALADNDVTREDEYYARLVAASGRDLPLQTVVIRDVPSPPASGEPIEVLQQRLAALETTVYNPAVDRVIKKIMALPPAERDGFASHLLQAGDQYLAQKESRMSEPA